MKSGTINCKMYRNYYNCKKKKEYIYIYDTLGYIIERFCKKKKE